MHNERLRVFTPGARRQDSEWGAWKGLDPEDLISAASYLATASSLSKPVEIRPDNTDAVNDNSSGQLNPNTL